MTTENTEHTETVEVGRNTKSDLRTGSADTCPRCGRNEHVVEDGGGWYNRLCMDCNWMWDYTPPNAKSDSSCADTSHV